MNNLINLTEVSQVISRYLGQKYSVDKALFLPRVYPFYDGSWVEYYTAVRKVHTGHWLYNNFDKNQVEFSEIRMSKQAALCGMEFFFTLKVRESLEVDPVHWADVEKTF